jgi:regulator of cell morphogenesis and NO signaling
LVNGNGKFLIFSVYTIKHNVYICFLIRISSVKLAQRTINSIIDENFVFAKVLDYFGVAFYKYSGHTLEALCKEKNLPLDKVLRNMERYKPQSQFDKNTIATYPVDLIIEYLKHSHHIFIKQKLPYLARLINGLDQRSAVSKTLADDLKFVFPLFLEDFIHHVYEEEDTLFAYVNSLYKVQQGTMPSSKLFYMLESYSIQEAALDHDHTEDELKGIREITGDYQHNPNNDLHLKVIYEEFKAFDRELVQHASIEDEVLFPKALMLEKSVQELINRKIRWN